MCSMKNGAGEGNRTLVASLEGWSFTTKLHPLNIFTGYARSLSRNAFLSMKTNLGFALRHF